MSWWDSFDAFPQATATRTTCYKLDYVHFGMKPQPNAPVEMPNNVEDRTEKVQDLSEEKPALIPDKPFHTITTGCSFPRKGSSQTHRHTLKNHFRLHVLTVTNQQYTIQVPKTASLSDLQTLIENETGIPSDYQVGDLSRTKTGL